MASVVMGLDRAPRSFGGAPAYALTDNAPSINHVCGIAVRNPQTGPAGGSCRTRFVAAPVCRFSPPRSLPRQNGRSAPTESTLCIFRFAAPSDHGD